MFPESESGYEVTYGVDIYMKSGAVVGVIYDDEAIVEDLKRTIADRVTEQLEFEDQESGSVTVIPKRNIDYLEITLVQ
jgi:hypothetical protein